MSRSFSRSSARGFSLRLASIAFCAASLVSVLVLSGSAHAQGLFQSPAPNLTTGTTPQGVAAADFNRSGFTGLVVANSHISGGRSTVSVFLGTGSNTFGGGTTYQTCTDPTAVLAKDVNNDGYPDIIVACTSSDTIGVLLNSGTGTFGAVTNYTFTGSPIALVAGDFVGNGRVDIAAANSGTNGGIDILLNSGTGTFTKSTSAVTGTLSGIAIGDFNKDGHLDLAVSDSTNSTVHVLTGSGTGTFTQHGTYSVGTGTQPSDIVAADFNNDGNLDVATVNAGKNTATILRGDGTGALTVQAAQTTGTDPIAIVATDVNGDGAPDVVAFDELTTTTGEVDVLLGNGNGTLQTAQTISQAFLPGTQAVVADFNRDGKPDLALAQQNNARASVLLNNTLPTAYPDGRSFAAANPLTVGQGNFADSVAVGDFNKDGLLDIAVSYLQDNTVQVMLNNGSNGFNPAAVYSAGNQPYSVASADLNGDGYADLVAVNTTDGTISVLLNTGSGGNGTFAAAAVYNVGKQPYQVAIGDVNGDGFPDLAVSNYGANTVSVLLGSKTGTFTAASTLSTCANPYGVGIGDFKHNGFPSVAVTCYSAAELEVFPNNGNGTFGTPFITPTETKPASLVVGDFNRDGNLDIVAANTTPNDIDFYAGNGNNTFAAGVESPSLNFPDSIAAGDFNNDGILDIVGVAPNFNAVELTLGVGDGTFGTFQQRAAGEFSAVKQPWALAVGDFNNDGQLDIVTANNFHQVNLDSPANQSRYLAEYPATPGGNPSIDLLTNASEAAIALSVAPPNNTFPLADNNSDVTIQATVSPAYSGVTPTGSVIFENSAGVVQGTGPYTLDSGGIASYDVGHLGSGSYVFTSLYSGDSNFQPATASGANFAVTVAGTPVTLTISPSSVVYGNTFTATVTVTGTGGEGRPTGTIVIDSSTGFELGTVTLANSGTNNTAGTSTFTALAPNLNAGSYNFYAVYTPTNGNYQPGTSSYAPLTVTAASTTISDLCLNIVFVSGCRATVAPSSGPAITGGVVNFTESFNGGPVGAPVSEPVAANIANYPNAFAASGSYTVVATFVPANGNYTGSSTSNTFQITCIIFGICIGGNDRRAPVTLNSFTGSGFTSSGFTENFFVPAGSSSDSTDNQNSRSNNRNTPFNLF